MMPKYSFAPNRSFLPKNNRIRTKEHKVFRNLIRYELLQYFLYKGDR